MRRFVFLLLRLTGLPFLLRELMQRRRVSILCYHDPRPEDFERHLRVLTKLYNVIPLCRYLDWRRTGESGLPRKALVITLDDGHKGNFLLREVLRRHDVPATIFVCSGVIGTRRHFWWKEAPDTERERLKQIDHTERLLKLAADTGFTETREYTERQALSMEETEELGRFVSFQSHTRFHPVLPTCGDKQAMEEIRGSKIELERVLGTSVSALAYPNGSYTEREMQFAREAGYECALTTDGGYSGRNNDRYRLPRLCMSDGAEENEVVVKASGLWSVWERCRRHLSAEQTPFRDRAANVAQDNAIS